MRSRGFTLIELLVVISIIGLLSSIILAALNGAHAKASDAQVESELRQVANQVEITNGNGDYGPTMSSGNCPLSGSGTTIFYDAKVELLNTIINNASGYVQCATGGSDANHASSWAVASQLPSTAGSPTHHYWCVDSKGVSKYVYAPQTWYMLALDFFTPKAEAGVGGINLGGGTIGSGGSAAACP